jgi:hypothetical protein
MDREFRTRWLREAQRSHGNKVRFATDSPVEGDGFEPSVPLRHRKAKSNGAGSKNVVPLTGDRGFESLFLQRGVRCEPDFLCCEPLAFGIDQR